LEGWGLETLLDRLPADSAVIVFEKDQELTVRCSQDWQSFLGTRGAVGLPGSDPRLFRLEADTEDDVRRLFRRLPLGSLRRCEFLTLNGAWLAHGARYREVFSRFEQGLNQWWANRVTCLHMGPLWIKNLFDNLSSGDFQPQGWPDWENSPVLVCGAGVSLETALPWAQRNRSALRLVAADTALPVLKAAGLTPDAVVCLEAQHANLRDFSGWKGADVPLFTDLTSYPPGTRVFSKPPHWFITEFAELSLWNRWPWTTQQIPRLPPLGSVGVAAAWVAWRLSQGPVILAGLDFSFPPGKTHARGAPSLTALAARTNRFVPMEFPGVWGRKTGIKPTAQGWLTTAVMEGYAGVMAEQAARESHRTWVWDTQGLPLGLPRWPSEERPSSPRESVVKEGGEPFSAEPQGAAWLANEQELWRTILDDYGAINRQPNDAGAWADLETHLAMVDYLTFSFPDPEFRRDSDWLIRAQSQVRWILERTSRPRSI